MACPQPRPPLILPSAGPSHPQQPLPAPPSPALQLINRRKLPHSAPDSSTPVGTIINTMRPTRWRIHRFERTFPSTALFPLQQQASLPCFSSLLTTSHHNTSTPNLSPLLQSPALRSLPKHILPHLNHICLPQVHPLRKTQPSPHPTQSQRHLFCARPRTEGSRRGARWS